MRLKQQQRPHIRIIGPSSHSPAGAMDAQIIALESMGCRVSVAEQVYTANRQSAGTEEEKVEALHAAYSDPDVDMIVAARGGNRR